MPLITCEMRWFHQGALPAEVTRWFDRGGPPSTPLWREDRYLVLPGVVDMGIKERDGRLEIKGRLARLGAHAIAPGIDGAAERWCKWSYGGANGERFRGCLQGHHVTVVGKERLQRHFLLQPGGEAQGTAQRDLRRRGFSLELTRVRLANDDHWSLGIEAAPDDDALLADLLRAIPDLLDGFPTPLPRSRSTSYAEWLARLELGA
ncbi:MAG TPA: hypothetical protein VFV80_07310 [Geminicoccaceae bacterium]|nr:hypothetical protein [Geminicoccaceae bacterium]